jgi:hypothetical protein
MANENRIKIINGRIRLTESSFRRLVHALLLESDDETHIRRKIAPGVISRKSKKTQDLDPMASDSFDAASMELVRPGPGESTQKFKQRILNNPSYERVDIRYDDNGKILGAVVQVSKDAKLARSKNAESARKMSELPEYRQGSKISSTMINYLGGRNRNNPEFELSRYISKIENSMSRDKDEYVIKGKIDRRKVEFEQMDSERDDPWKPQKFIDFRTEVREQSASQSDAEFIRSLERDFMNPFNIKVDKVGFWWNVPADSVESSPSSLRSISKNLHKSIIYKWSYAVFKMGQDGPLKAVIVHYDWDAHKKRSKEFAKLGIDY